MTTPLLKAKLHIPPLRAEPIPRPHLIDRLNAGLGHKLILLSAPAGFGKTTLLSEWIGRTGIRAAWLSLDEHDNDVARLLQYIVAALQTVEPDLGTAALALLEPRQAPEVETALTVLLNELGEDTGPLVLVLDDYHLITEQPVHHALTYLLDHLPPQVHLVLSTRADPPLPIPRLRSEGQLAELRQADLRFSPQEAAALVGQIVNVPLSRDDIAALTARTEGWAAALQMAALALQGQVSKNSHPGASAFIAAFSGRHEYVADYLADEVIGQQPEHVQAFLFQTSVLDRLCGSLCEALTGRSRAQEMLEQLSAANLFVVPLDSERQWYRYHRLFADLIRQRLQRTGPDRIAELHHRASLWYEGQGEPEAAIEHAFRAGDEERAAALVEAHALPAIARSHVLLVGRWLDRFPEARVRARPLLCVARAWIALIGPHHAPIAAEAWLRRAEAALATDAEQGEGADTTHQLVLSQAATLRAIISAQRHAPPTEVIALLEHALQLTPPQDRATRSVLSMRLGLAHLQAGAPDQAEAALIQAWELGVTSSSDYAAFVAAYLRATIAIRRGQLHKATSICQQALDRAGQAHAAHKMPIAGAVMIILARILTEQGRMPEAWPVLQGGIALVELLVEPEILVEGQMALARLLLAKTDAERALERYAEAAAQWPQYESYVSAHRVRAWLSLANRAPRYLDDVARWISAQPDQLDAPAPYYPFEVGTFARAQLALRRAGRPAMDLHALLRFLETRAQEAERLGWRGDLLDLLVLQALAWQDEGNEQRALAAIERALDLAEPETYVCLFVDGGLPMAQLLRGAVGRGIHSAYASRLLAAMADASPQAPTPSGLVEPLSERELEVLRLLGTHLSAPEIADALYIAPSTVRTHIRSIYGKLGVHARGEAVRQAKELGLL